MAGKKRESCRELADYFACGFPARSGWVLDYATYVGLLQNKHRIRRQRSVSVLEGMAACSNDPLDDGWGDALADSKQEAQEITYEANAARARARSLARMRSSNPHG